MERTAVTNPADMSDTVVDEINWQAELTQHDRWLRNVVLARVGERQAVDDVMQEVSLAAIRQQAPLRDPSKVGAWLYRLAVTKSLLYRRTMGRRRNLHKRYAERVESSHPGPPDPLGWMLDSERQGKIREAIMALSTKDKEILLLKYTENWTYQQLADRLEISNAAVESRLHRARARMRRQLARLNVIGESS
ncbi:MAG: RNA polymerase sigma factor [Planctomycetales bacterium]